MQDPIRLARMVNEMMMAVASLAMMRLPTDSLRFDLVHHPHKADGVAEFSGVV